MATPKVPAHIQAPPQVELKDSLVDGNRIGAFCKDELIPKDCEFGPFAGRIVYDKNSEDVDQKYSWEVYDLETFKFLHIVDATNSDDGNWMRYVCCARFFEEQNIVSTQNGTDVYYRALKDIKPGEELLTWFQPKKKRKRSSLRDSKESADSVVSAEALKEVNEEAELGTGKRKRKPKIIPDSYQGPLDFKMSNVTSKKVKKVIDEDDFEPLQPGQKRRRRKKVTQVVPVSPTVEQLTPSTQTTDEVTKTVKTETVTSVIEPLSEVKTEPIADDETENRSEMSIDESDEEKEAKQLSELIGVNKLRKLKRQKGTPMTLTEGNNLVEWQYPKLGEEYTFKLKGQQVLQSSKARRIYQCDICMGLYRQMFSLKRHYLRNHINYKYLSKADIINCSINLVYVKKMMYERSVFNEWKENGNDKEAKATDSFFEKLDKTVKPNSQDCSEVKEEVEDNLNSQHCSEVKEEVEDPVFDKLEAEYCDHVKESQSNVENLSPMNTDDLLETCESARESVKCSKQDKSEKEKHLDDVTNDKSNQGEQIHGENEVENMDLNDELDTDPLTDKDITEDQSLQEELLKIQKENKSSETNNVLEGSTNSVCEANETETEAVNNEAQNEVTADINDTSSPKDDETTKHLMPGLYRCYTCNAVYDTIQELRDHLDDHPDQAYCFACDQCNMRFHFKQNLVRHQKVHEDTAEEGKKVKKIWAKKMGDDSKIKKKKKKKVHVERKAEMVADKPVAANPLIEPKGTSDNLFKCNKCKTIFPNQRVLTSHVQTEHKDGGKFQCQYCGKEFPSMPNMKKHVRFHLGYRVRCRVCNEIFSNVGALRKHTRLVHPDIYKARRLDKLARDGALRVPDKDKVKIKVADDLIVKEKKHFQKKRKLAKISKPVVGKKKVAKIEPVDETPVNDIKEDSKEGSSEEFLLETADITFEAHEIDDGGSRFKFSCNVCKKRFNSYINMCRHRRKVHNSENKQKLEEGLIFTRKSKNSTPTVVEDQKELEQFYANISHNIAVNLNCFIDGKPESLVKYSDHIIVENYKEGSFGYCEHSTDVTDISWEQYNFPPDFKPVFTVPVGEIKTETVDETETDYTAGRTCLNGEHIVDENKVNSCDNTNIAESEHCENSTSETEAQLKDQPNQLVDTPEDNMGKSSTGIKALASVGMNAMQKIAKSFENLKGDSEKQDPVPSFITDRDVLRRNSPSSKNFCQVQNGEYSNFDDLMLGDDFSTLTRNDDGFRRSRAHSSASSRMLKQKLKYKRSHSAGDLIDSEDTHNAGTSSDDLYDASQAELDELYSCLDTGVEYHVPKPVTSPKSLSILCERILGLKASDSKSMPGTDITETKSTAALHLLSNLSLSENQRSESDDIVKMKPDIKPDYSDATIESPFYNYDSIAFGKNGEITKVCAICKKHFANFDCLVHHHTKIHPSSACNFLEIEDGNDIESLHFAHASNIGVLAVTDPGLGGASNVAAFTCTRCGNAFKSKARLHVHIVNCSPIDPVYGAIKDTSSPANSPLKKGFHYKPDEHLSQYDIKNPYITSRKRVFTGCRKRTAVLLPDSPVKMAFSDKAVQDILSGYNPNNHIRRRELTELVDTLTCEACGQKFKTIILLERHVKNCAEKEKFKNVRPLACPIMDESLAKIKNICFYCNKNFTYSKSLMNHFQDFCPVKKMKVDRGDLTKEDTVKEKTIMERLLKQEEEKVSKDKEMDGLKKKSWQVGRKPKRKGHSWTYIKKRKQNSLSSLSGLQENEGDEEDDSDESSTYGSVQNGEKLSDTENDPLQQLNETIHKHHDANGNFVQMDSVVKVESASCNFDEVDSFTSTITKAHHKASINHIPEIQQRKAEGSVGETVGGDLNNLAERSDFEMNKVKTEKDMMLMNGFENEERDRTGVDELLSHWDRDANTSLEFTSRYKVNRVSAPAKKTMTKKPSLLQCVMAHGKRSPVKEFGSDKDERTKRKRERCGKVEAFLQNVFKRKKKKEALTQNNQGKGTEKESISFNTPIQNEKLLEAHILEKNEKGNTLLDLPYTNTNTKTDIQSLSNVTNDELTHLPTYFSQQDKVTNHEINRPEHLPGIEVKQEESGRIRYLFKRGRPRKYKPMETTDNSKNGDIETGIETGMKKQHSSGGNNQKKVSSGRGRPRKYPVKEISTEKRPRGRPPKFPTYPGTNVRYNIVNILPGNKDNALPKMAPETVSDEAAYKLKDNLKGANTFDFPEIIESKDVEYITWESTSENQIDLQDLNQEDYVKGKDYSAQTMHGSPITESETTKTASSANEQTLENCVHEVKSKNNEDHLSVTLLQSQPTDVYEEEKIEESETSMKDFVDTTKCVKRCEYLYDKPIANKDNDSEDVHVLCGAENVESRCTENDDEDFVKPPELECEYLNSKLVMDESTEHQIEASHNTNVNVNSYNVPIDVPPVLEPETDQVSSSDSQSVVNDTSICDSDGTLNKITDDSDNKSSDPITIVDEEKENVTKVLCEIEETYHGVIKTLQTEVITNSESVPNECEGESLEKLDVPKDQQNESLNNSESVSKEGDDEINLLELYSSVILSPSERVKTNKRNCKKESSPYSPVWVKQKPRTKTGNTKSDIKVNPNTVELQDDKNDASTEKTVIEDTCGSDFVNGANIDFKGRIPKALKRKLEIVRKFDSRRKMLNQ